MKRLEYLTRFRNKLEEGGLAKEEIENVLEYYEEIFFDAGKENEEKVSSDLGEPEQLARKVLLENGIHADGKAEFIMEEASGFNGESAGKEGWKDDDFRKQDEQAQQQQRNNNLLKFVTAIITIPLWLVVVLVFAIIGICFLVTACALSAVFFVIGICAVIGGVVGIFAAPPVGVCLLGIGLVLVGLFGLLIVPIVKAVVGLAIRLLNWVIAGIRRFFGIGGDRSYG